MVLREFRNNAELQYIPVGFIDDDARKHGKVISSLKVFDANGSLPEICEELNVDEIVISFREFEPETLTSIREFCRDNNIALKRAHIRIDPIEFE